MVTENSAMRTYQTLIFNTDNLKRTVMYLALVIRSEEIGT